MTGLYFLGGLDMYTTYGFVPSPGCSDDILKPRKRKEPYSNDWPDEQGKEYDVSGAVKYDDRQIRLSGHLICSNESDYWSKYNALIAAFNATGTLVLKCNEFAANRDVKVFYLDTPTLTRLTRVKGGDKVVVKIELLLQEYQQAV